MSLLLMRDTCLRCENEGERTQLVLTIRGGICPIHEPEFLQRLINNAKLTLGIPLSFDPRGTPNPRQTP